MALERKNVDKFMGVVDPIELAVCIAESALQLRRMTGLTAQQAFELMDLSEQAMFKRGALAAIEFMAQCMMKAKRAN